MKQVLLFLAIAACYCNCNNSTEQNSSAEEKTKTDLLKLAGFDKMDTSFTYEYLRTNDSTIGFLNLVPANQVVEFKGDEASKGKLLNTFSMGGREYKTILQTHDSSFALKVTSIDGVVVDDNIFERPPQPPGQPPLLCEDCNSKCIDYCIDYYLRSIYPDLQRQANRTCRNIFYCMACPLGRTPCYFITFVVRPWRIFCYVKNYELEEVATQKMVSGMVIKNPSAQNQK